MTPHTDLERARGRLPVARARCINMLAPPSWRFLAALVGAKHGLAVDDIMGRGRTKPVASARHETWMLVYQHTQFGVTAIGRIFDRDHCSIHHAISKRGNVRKLVEKPAQLPAAPYNRLAQIRTQRRNSAGAFIPMDSPNA